MIKYINTRLLSIPSADLEVYQELIWTQLRQQLVVCLHLLMVSQDSINVTTEAILTGRMYFLSPTLSCNQSDIYKHLVDRVKARAPDLRTSFPLCLSKE
jgi:hypothetical protein